MSGVLSQAVSVLAMFLYKSEAITANYKANS